MVFTRLIHCCRLETGDVAVQVFLFSDCVTVGPELVTDLWWRRFEEVYWCNGGGPLIVTFLRFVAFFNVSPLPVSLIRFRIAVTSTYLIGASEGPEDEDLVRR